MAVYELGADTRAADLVRARNVALQRRDPYGYAIAERFARRASSTGSASVQVQRRLSAATNRSPASLGADDDAGLGGFLSKIGGALKTVAKVVVKPVASVAAAVGVPGAGLVNSLVNRPAPAKAPPVVVVPPPAVARVRAPAPALLKAPPLTRAKPAPKPAPLKAKPVAVAARLKVAPDAVVRPGPPVAAAVLTSKEASLSARLVDAKAAGGAALKAHNLAQAAKKQSLTLKDRAQRLATNATGFAAKAAKLAAAGDAVGAAKFAEQARAVGAIATNTAVAAASAGDYAERAGNAIAAGTDAGIAAAATNSEGFGGFFAKLQANPILALGGAAVLGLGGYVLLRKKRGGR